MFADLVELIILEQFKNVIPQRIATYLSERKPSTVLKAAELADDFVLTHKASFVEGCSGADGKGADNLHSGAKLMKPGLSRKPAWAGRHESTRVCNYCRTSVQC